MPPVQVAAALGPLLELLNLAGIAVFALSGALLAAEKRQDIVTFSFFAVVTGVGGGTVRDLLIGAPVFWVHENATLLICLVAAIAVWVLPKGLWQGRALLWFDAAGLAAFSAFGAAKGLAFGLAPLPAFGMGVVTGCVGGIIRDLLAGEPTILMQRELYVTCAALSAAALVGLVLVGVPGGIAGLGAALAGFVLRGLVIWRGWSLTGHGDRRR
jgi:uncharacterized membrane protein YeiH